MAYLSCGALNVILIATRIGILLVRLLLNWTQTKAFILHSLRFAPFVWLKISFRHNRYPKCLKVPFQNLRSLQHLCTFWGRKKVVISSFPNFKGKGQVTAMYLPSWHHGKPWDIRNVHAIWPNCMFRQAAPRFLCPKFSRLSKYTIDVDLDPCCVENSS